MEGRIRALNDDLQRRKREAERLKKEQRKEEKKQEHNKLKEQEQALKEQIEVNFLFHWPKKQIDVDLEPLFQSPKK